MKTLNNIVFRNGVYNNNIYIIYKKILGCNGDIFFFSEIGGRLELKFCDRSRVKDRITIFNLQNYKVKHKREEL